MPTVSDLLCIWCSTFGSFRVGTATIPTDDLYTRMLFEPFFQGRGLSIWEGINGDILVSVDQDRPVGFAPTKREVIHPKHAWGGYLFFWLSANEPSSTYFREEDKK